MNYSDLENLENKVANDGSAGPSNYHQMMLQEYLEKENRKASSKSNPFVYFYEDVISYTIEYDFKASIGDVKFKNASDDALACLSSCNEFSRISSWVISGWLQNALKFADHIVLHYIQDYCKEIPRSYPNTGNEKARYLHLSEKDGDISVAGAELKDLYDLRNELEHRTITHTDGTQELISPKRNKVRHIVAKLYPDVLERFLRTYKKELPINDDFKGNC
ncbi:MAG: hypothetical protein KBC43_03195 [Bacteroidales bacterium]|nr:hypothetical protein [Bacteroidales bacterium]